jgi:hypothetical protein
MLTRRVFAGMLGTVAGSGKHLAAAAEKVFSENMANQGKVDRFVPNCEASPINSIPQRMSFSEARRLVFQDKDLLEHARDNIREQYKTEAIIVFDPDIENKRSFSTSYKVLLQRERNIDRILIREFGLRDKSFGEMLNDAVNKLMYG